MRIYPEVMEPLFNYAGHGSANDVKIPNLAAVAGGRRPRAATG